MNEASAREVVLLQAFETASPPSPSWGDEDRAWATRLALQHGTGDDFIARRAHHAMQRLAPREPAAAKWLARRAWRPAWWVAAALAGLVLGLLADSIGGTQRVNLLAPPLWGLVTWNLVVYVLLVGHALAALMRRRPPHPGALNRVTQRALRLGGAALVLPELPSFAMLWWRASAPLSAARAAMLLHTAAALLGVGLIAGLYLRGLVFDYRAAWESTFLAAPAAHALLSAVLAPAVELSGIALPDAAGFEALREAHGSTSPGASAAPWIHLFALTLALFVVLPRTLLALWSGARAWCFARRMPIPLDDPYFQRLQRERQGDVAMVSVLPYATTPSGHVVVGLRAVLARALGDDVNARVAPTTPFGGEDDPPAPPPGGTTHLIALFDLAGTPEDENHGRFARQLAAAAPEGAVTLVMVNESAFAKRFEPARVEQRRAAWRAFGDTLGTTPVFVDLAAPDVPAGARALQLAGRMPVKALG